MFVGNSNAPLLWLCNFHFPQKFSASPWKNCPPQHNPSSKKHITLFWSLLNMTFKHEKITFLRGLIFIFIPYFIGGYFQKTCRKCGFGKRHKEGELPTQRDCLKKEGGRLKPSEHYDQFSWRSIIYRLGKKNNNLDETNLISCLACPTDPNLCKYGVLILLTLPKTNIHFVIFCHRFITLLLKYFICY